jgi:uncharacterized protein (DUF3820 family)
VDLSERKSWPNCSIWPLLAQTNSIKVEKPMQAEDLALLLTREMPFGKYQGRVIADLPGDYLAWFSREGFPKGEIGGLLALMYEIDHNDLRALLLPLRKK